MPDNIIVIMADDHGQWAMGAYGNGEIHTPTLDYLADTGVLMENAFTPTPVCSPARASLLTGRLASQHGIHDYLSSREEAIHRRPWLADEVTLPQTLQEAGYETALAGKWHLGADEEPAASFDFWFSLTGDYPAEHSGEIRYCNQGEIETRPGYTTQVITEEALRFLQQRDEERPFFLFVNYTGTHSPWRGHPERLVEQYRDCRFEGMGEQSTYPFGRLALESTLPMRLDPEEARAQYYAAVSHMDEGIGRLLDQLEAQGLRQETLVVYTSDHGLNCGHHGIWGKGNGTLPLNMVEESIRVPLLFNQPGRLFGRQRRREFVDHLDLYQTLVHYAELELPWPQETYPGRTFLPLLENSGALPEWRNVQFGEYGNLRMIRTERFKLVRRYPDGPYEFFDLGTDPGETVNRFHDTAFLDVVQRLSEQIDDYFQAYENPAKSGLRTRELPRHNDTEAWRAES